MTAPTRSNPALRRWRVGANIAFYSFVVLIIVVLSGQVSYQVLFPATKDSAFGCKDGISFLARSIASSRETAAREPSTEQAIRRFRAEMQVPWLQFPAIAKTCEQAGDMSTQTSIDAVERLRFAEENALRRESVDLAPLRRTLAPFLAPQPSASF